MELPVGVGALALFLTPYLRISINPVIPLGVISLGCLYSLRRGWQSRFWLLSQLNRHSTALFVTLCAMTVLSLSFPTIGDGFLLFPVDFDSNLIHVTGPEHIVSRGYFFSPNWLRGVWLPQLTMVLYTFILSFSSQLFLKTLNVICFIHLALLFGRSTSSATGRVVALACFITLSVLPEFRQYIVQTNLDTIFALFAVSSFVLLQKHIKKPELNSLLLIGFICGLSAGQKHFGLMYSAPILVMASLLYMWQTGSVRSAVGRIPSVAGCGLIFAATFSCFFLHNILAGNALLFPFLGSKINTYGWTDADLLTMLETTIPQWGHSKTLAGFFLLPFHLIQYPNEYQFQVFGRWADLGVSVAIGSLYLATCCSLLLKPLRRADVLIPCIVLCADVFLWFRGSQVIRYLFPVLISATMLANWLLQLAVERISKASLLSYSIAIAGVVFASFASSIWMVQPQTPLAQTRDEMRQWFSTYRGANLDAFKWLTQNTPHGTGILNIAGQAELAQFPELVLCGDFFGRCRHYNFIGNLTKVLNIQFYPWDKLKEQFRANQIQYIVVNWNMFERFSWLPKNEAEWAVSLPESTRNCLEDVYNDGASTYVYKIKESCLR
jgi:hypothetical protein